MINQAERWVSIAEAARMKGVGRASIYAAIEDSKIRASEIGGRRLALRQDVEAYVPRAYQGRRENTRPAGVRGPGGRPKKSETE